MELKLCPFCGGEAASYKDDVFGCSSCDCWVDTAEEWNRREYPAPRKLVERWRDWIGAAEYDCWEDAVKDCADELERLIRGE